jgi:hypothetical protein
VLAASSLLFAAGLTLIGLAPNLPVYLAGWIVVGMAMGAGLYDAAFAALGQLYGHAARNPITNLTLFGGFASTVCWPLSAFMIGSFGWRPACLIYAALHLCVALPLQFVMPLARQATAASSPASAARETTTRQLTSELIILVLIALVMSIATGIGSIVIVHLLIFLQARGVDFAAAVALGTLFGPAQVGARVVERLFGQHYHPVWTMIASCLLMAGGLIMLLTGFPLLAIVILVYGAGYGISWIARGTLPLALFGPERYPVLIGRLAFPSLVVQALAPAAGAFAIERFGVQATIATLTVLALVNVAAIAALYVLCRGQTNSGR